MCIDVSFSRANYFQVFVTDLNALDIPKLEDAYAEVEMLDRTADEDVEEDSAFKGTYWKSIEKSLRFLFKFYKDSVGVPRSAMGQLRVFYLIEPSVMTQDGAGLTVSEHYTYQKAGRVAQSKNPSTTYLKI